MTKSTYWLRLSVATMLIAGGLLGFAAFGPWSPTEATAASAEESHETMHRMMDAMQGPGTAERMHEVEGAEGMMETCSRTMESMGSMMERSPMMDGGMGEMMGRPGMGGMMDGR